MNLRTALVALLAMAFVIAGCKSRYREDLDYSHNVEQTWKLEELNFGEIVQFETVFWEPDDTVSLRAKIVDDSIASGRDVLEIGTGTGILSILCMQYDAKSVVATDINPAAVANAKYNAAFLAPDEEFDIRKVDKDAPGAFAVIADDERFDLIISNPPWEDGVIVKPADHAFYDPSFALMDSLLDGLPKHLSPGGRCLLAYGNVTAIRRLLVEAERRNYEFKILDDRELDSLEENFLPGMLIQVRPPLDTSKVSAGTFQESEATQGDLSGDEDTSRKKPARDPEPHTSDPPATSTEAPASGNAVETNTGGK